MMGSINFAPRHLVRTATGRHILHPKPWLVALPLTLAIALFNVPINVGLSLKTTPPHYTLQKLVTHWKYREGASCVKLY